MQFSPSYCTIVYISQNTCLTAAIAKLLTMYVMQKGNTVYLLYNVLSSMGFNSLACRPSQPAPRYAAVQRRVHGFAASGEGQCALD